MPINAHPDYIAAEKKFLECQTDDERVFALEDMIRKAPSHKGAENLRAQLRIRLKKLKEKLEKGKKRGKGKEGIKKADMQAIIIGFTNSGKSSILKSITNATPKINPNMFTTTFPEIGTLIYQGVQIQIIDEPAIESEDFDTGLIHTADTLIIIVSKIEEIEKINDRIKDKTRAKKIIVFNKIDLLDEKSKRKISETLKSKRYDFVLTSTINQEGIDELKEKIFQTFDIVRIYLKEPGKEPTNIPMVLGSGATIQKVAEKISKEMLKNIKEIHIWGPSSKFPNQKVGLTHKLKDKDIVEFKTR